MSKVEFIVWGPLALAPVMITWLGLVWLQFRLTNPYAVRNATAAKKWGLALLLGALYASVPYGVFLIVLGLMLIYVTARVGSAEGAGSFFLLMSAVTLGFGLITVPVMVLAVWALMQRWLFELQLWERWHQNPPDLEHRHWTMRLLWPSWWLRLWLKRWEPSWRILWRILYPGARSTPFDATGPGEHTTTQVKEIECKPDAFSPS